MHFETCYAHWISRIWLRGRSGSYSRETFCTRKEVVLCVKMPSNSFLDTVLDLSTRFWNLEHRSDADFKEPVPSLGWDLKSSKWRCNRASDLQNLFRMWATDTRSRLGHLLNVTSSRIIHMPRNTYRRQNPVRKRTQFRVWQSPSMFKTMFCIHSRPLRLHQSGFWRTLSTVCRMCCPLLWSVLQHFQHHQQAANGLSRFKINFCREHRPKRRH